MLYFSIVPDGKSTAINPSSDKPYHLCVAKTTIQPDIIFDKDEGVCRMFFTFTEPRKWQEETIALSNFSHGSQRYSSTQESILLENSLFYRDEEYTTSFLNTRFADDLNSMMQTIHAFDAGVIWHALLQLNDLLVKFDNHTPAISDKEIGRLTRAIGTVIHSTERSIALTSKLIYSAHRVAECYPGTIHDTRSFTINKAYIYYAYLFFLPLKEFYASKVLPRGRENGFLDYLLDCCPSINIHSFTTTYDLMYAKESEDDMLDKLIKSPSRDISKCTHDIKITPSVNQSDVNISMSPLSSAYIAPVILKDDGGRIIAYSDANSTTNS